MKTGRSQRKRYMGTRSRSSLKMEKLDQQETFTHPLYHNVPSPVEAPIFEVVHPGGWSIVSRHRITTLGTTLAVVPTPLP